MRWFCFCFWPSLGQRYIDEASNSHDDNYIIKHNYWGLKSIRHCVTTALIWSKMTGAYLHFVLNKFVGIPNSGCALKKSILVDACTFFSALLVTDKSHLRSQILDTVESFYSPSSIERNLIVMYV